MVGPTRQRRPRPCPYTYADSSSQAKLGHGRRRAPAALRHGLLRHAQHPPQRHRSRLLRPRPGRRAPGPRRPPVPRRRPPRRAPLPRAATRPRHPLPPLPLQSPRRHRLLRRLLPRRPRPRPRRRRALQAARRPPRRRPPGPHRQDARRPQRRLPHARLSPGRAPRRAHRRVLPPGVRPAPRALWPRAQGHRQDRLQQGRLRSVPLLTRHPAGALVKRLQELVRGAPHERHGGAPRPASAGARRRRRGVRARPGPLHHELGPCLRHVGAGGRGAVPGQGVRGHRSPAGAAQACPVGGPHVGAPGPDRGGVEAEGKEAWIFLLCHHHRGGAPRRDAGRGARRARPQQAARGDRRGGGRRGKDRQRGAGARGDGARRGAGGGVPGAGGRPCASGEAGARGVPPRGRLPRRGRALHGEHRQQQCPLLLKIIQAPRGRRRRRKTAMETLLLLCATLSLVLVASLVLLLRQSHGRINDAKTSRLPPGPPALVFLAKFLALRRSVFDLGPLLRELHARHGPVISLLLARTLVFVADRHLAHRALVQGGATFADRPPLVEPGRLFTAGARDISTSPYGPYWRLVRRNLAAEALHPARVSLFAPARRRARDALLADLLRARGGDGTRAVEVRPLFRRTMLELLVCMSLGARLGAEELDEIQELQLQILRSVTSFPIFAFFPAVTKRLFRGRWEAYVTVRRRLDDIFVPLINARRDAACSGDPPCYADSLLALRVADEGDRPLTDAEMVSLCSEFLNGGTDTTVTLLEWIMAELVNHPDVQAKVYEEVKSRAGELDERYLQSVPYLKAVVMEGLRLHPPGHFVLPHGVTSDAEIGGYTVPKGAEVNFLVASFGRDETAWTAPLEFRPERFVDGGEGCDVDVTGSREIRMMPFGAGRRMCPGYTLGLLHLEFLVASLLRELEWLPPADGDAVDMTEVLDFTTVMKHPLRARIRPRT